ncbi:hypothetical protein DSECCO2_582910 [anaerobic digester metagenome]
MLHRPPLFDESECRQFDFHHKEFATCRIDAASVWGLNRFEILPAIFIDGADYERGYQFSMVCCEKTLS